MVFDQETKSFIAAVCEKVYKEEDYNVFIKKVTDLVDEYGRMHGLDADAMDAIQNEIFIRMGR